MKKYNVEVIRVSYSAKTFEVSAENEQDAKNKAFDMATDSDYSGSEYDCEYEVNTPQEISNDYIDQYGNPYDSEDDKACWPAGGGLHKKCDHNADALYAYYTIKDRVKIADYLFSKGFKEILHGADEEIWVNGNTEITYESYVDGMWGYMHTELV